MSFKSANETMEIRDGKLTYSVSRYKYKNRRSTTPLRTEDKEIYKDYVLSKKFMRELRKIIQESNYGTLPNVFGAPPNTQHTPETLKISYKDQNRSLTYRRNPQYPPPNGYEKLKSEIFNLIDMLE